MRAVAAVGLAALGIAVAAVRATEAVPPIAGTDPAKGRQLYVSQGCYQCHGYAGQGSIISGPSLVPMHLDDAFFVGYIRKPSGVMPPYSEHVLSPASLAAIARYLRSFPPGRPASAIPELAGYLTAGGTTPLKTKAMPAAARVPAPHASVSGGAARAGRGAALYASNCAVCHGAAREGGSGPELRGQAARRTVDEIAALISAPPPGMPKLSPEPLSVEQARAVATFVHSGS